MLSIEEIGPGGDYHAYLTSDYYLDHAQAVRWLGQGAVALGLTGSVEAKTFRDLLLGFGPDGKRLVQNAGKTGASGHDPGWDFTFSAPKDVSTVWAVADQETRDRISQCHEAAVRDALDYLDTVAGQARQKAKDGSGWIERVEAKLVFAAFGHGASREQDPQLHTHCVGFNVAVRQDGTTGAVFSLPLFRHKMAAGALYQASLAAYLTRTLGLTLTGEKTGFRIEGTPEELSREWSKRREQIEEALGGKSGHSAKAAAVAAKMTRKGKVPTQLGELLEGWKETASRYKFGPDAVKRLLGREKSSEKDREKLTAQGVSKGAESVLEKNSHISVREVIKASADRLRNGTANAAEIRTAVSEWFQRPDVVQVGQRKGETRYTTKAVIEEEKKLLEDAKTVAATKSHPVPTRAAERALGKFSEDGVSADDAKRNRGQRAAVEWLLQPQALTAVSGMAGTGKSTVLKAAREAWEQAGYKVTGIALAGIAAKNLASASGLVT